MFPPRRVLAAVDFSECSRVALNAAARLATHCGATLQVLHVQDPLLARAAAVAGIDLQGETKDELMRFVRTATRSRTNAEQLVIAGKAADVICQIARRDAADLVVIGAHGMSGMAHTLFGSTAERVIRCTRRSVLVVPASWGMTDPDAIDLTGAGPVLAGVEATADALAAAAAAADLALLLHTSLELIHVVAPIATPQRWASHAQLALQDAMQSAEQELAGLARTLQRDVPVRTLVTSGPVASTLDDAARATPGANPIIVLGRNREGSSSGEPGAIAHRVLMKAPAPILIVLPSD